MDQASLNHRWAELIVEELVRSGTDYFCLAPGSRSTPLTTAVARHPSARHVMHFDERGTAFHALGYGRATGRPAAWITTSGTAVANGLPAVVEAATDGVPMLLLTADRPPELRDTGANQTIDQVGLFGRHVRWQFDLPVPDAAVDPAVVLTTVDQAAFRARAVPPGPVHLNCMFRAPLAPPGEGTPPTAADGLGAWRHRTAPYTRYAASRPALQAEEVARVWALLRGVERGLVVAGSLPTPVQADAVRWIAEVLGWPLLPDVGSHLRLGHEAGGETRIDYFDQVLGSERFAGRHAPEAVLHVGGRPTSKRLLQYLDAHRPPVHVVVREDGRRFDPSHGVTHRFQTDVVDFCHALARRVHREDARPDGGPWRRTWLEASAVAGRVVSERLSGASLSEPAVARLLSREIPEDHGLCLGSSMPVRDVDMFARGDGACVRVAANRGASGIDGTVATAAGFAAGLQAPVTLLVGDLALLHDLNSLALLGEARVVVVVVNNHGGGIFSFLPIARHADVFEPFFGTPHGYGFAPAAEMFGLAYATATSADGFVDAYRAACGRDGATLLEVVTERSENRALHEALLRAVDDAVG